MTLKCFILRCQKRYVMTETANMCMWWLNCRLEQNCLRHWEVSMERRAASTSQWNRKVHLDELKKKTKKCNKDVWERDTEKQSGCCRCQAPICMNCKGINCWGWESNSVHPPPPLTLLLGRTKRRCDAHDCLSLQRQGSEPNEGPWV